jgi:excisionase family DNA binding protein
MKAVLEKPTLQDQQVASESLDRFSAAMSKRGLSTVKIRIQEMEEFITIPRKALELLAHILSNMADGKAISLIPSNSEVSTQQAANMLNVSRPHVIKLLEKGIIPFKKVGSHRRVSLEDLLVYQARLKEEREKALQFLADQAQELNFGYE